MERFINPYNFISLSDAAPQRQDEEKGKRFTGCIKYTLKTKSPLFIPNTSSSKAFAYTPDENDDPKGEHQLYDFFSYNILEPDQRYDEMWFEPVVPGSEVRGMIRSIYETLTNSCLSVSDGERVISKRTIEHFKPGVLQWSDNNIVLWDASKTDAIYREKNDFSDKRYQTCAIPDGTKVSFRVERPSSTYAKPDVTALSENEEEYPKKGYILKGNQGPEIASGKNTKCYQNGQPCVMLRNGKCVGKNQNAEHCFKAEKHCVHIFSIPNKGTAKKVTEKSMDTLRVVLEQYIKNDPACYQEYKTAYEKFITHRTDGLPVYYSESVGDHYYLLSPACITREVYKNTVNILTDSHKTCNSKERKLCPACRLFGIVNSNIAQGSKIRFSDLYPVHKVNENREYYDEILVLDPLGVPHLESTEFYLKKPLAGKNEEVWFWTYDYYTVKKDGKVIVKPYKPEISGRKFYWNKLTGVEQCPRRTPLNRTVRPVKAEVEFSGEVYFDEITEKQLKQLIYILTYTADGKHGYKLGMGKPLGLGSVELSVHDPQDISLREFDGNEYKFSHEWNPEKIGASSFEELELDGKAEASFELMTRYLKEDEMKKIHYPKTGEEQEEEGFKWFMDNRVSETASPRFRTQAKICEELPGLGKGQIPWMSAKPSLREPEPNEEKTGGQKNYKTRAASPGNAADENSNTAVLTASIFNRSKEYRAKVLSVGRPAQNKKFMEYDIEILNVPECRNKKYIASVHKNEKLKIQDEIDVVWYKGKTFNLKPRKRF